MTSDPLKHFDVFLCHNSADKAEVTAVADKLSAARLRPFLDKWHLTPGKPWQEEIEEALDRSASCAVFLGSEGFSPWANEEMRAALEKRAANPHFRVIPVVLADASTAAQEEMAPFLRRFTWVDFQRDDHPVERLIAAIRARSGSKVRSQHRWNVPHQRNRFFTGRDDVLEQLHQALNRTGSAALGQAISGLGGIGKTQTAVEFAYRYRDEYKTVLWSRAESEAELIAGMVDIAEVLELPERDAEEQELVVQAVRRWMAENPSWLWVLDNADTPSILARFLPIAPRGHLLVTSRAENFDALEMDPLKVPVMSPEEAINFLLERTRRPDPPDEEKEAAATLAEELGYLPLALEQAGAYISGHHTRFVDYLASYHHRRLQLLGKGQLRDGRQPVATTWSLNFDEVAAASQAAAELLQLSAFLAPDRIPIELMIGGAEKLGPALSQALEGAAADPLLIDELLEPLSRYSLIERDSEGRTFGVHRMVQAVVKDSLAKEARRSWVERAVEGLRQAYPGPEFAAWSRCDGLVPHWRIAADWIDQYALESAAAGALLNQAGGYAWDRARFSEAEPLYQRSIEIKEKALGPEHPSLALGLDNYAALLRSTDRKDEAKVMEDQAKAIRAKRKVMKLG